MTARLLTPAEVRAELGPRAIGMSEDDLIEIARRIRQVSTVLVSVLASGRASALPAVPSV